MATIITSKPNKIRQSCLECGRFLAPNEGVRTTLSNEKYTQVGTTCKQGECRQPTKEK